MAHEHQDVGRDDSELLAEPGCARSDMGERRLPVEASLPTLLPPEVLDGIGQIDVVPAEPDAVERSIQDAAGWPDEGTAVEIL